MSHYLKPQVREQLTRNLSDSTLSNEELDRILYAFIHFIGFDGLLYRREYEKCRDMATKYKETHGLYNKEGNEDSYWSERAYTSAFIACILSYVWESEES